MLLAQMVLKNIGYILLFDSFIPPHFFGFLHIHTYLLLDLGACILQLNFFKTSSYTICWSHIEKFSASDEIWSLNPVSKKSSSTLIYPRLPGLRLFCCNINYVLQFIVYLSFLHVQIAKKRSCQWIPEF